MKMELVPKVITPSEIFVPKGLDPILAGVRAKVKEFKPESLDMEVLKDRDKLRSFAADIASSKTFIDDKRKLFVKDKKAELKIIDAECKAFRDEMDSIKEATRKPLTDWENAEKIRVEQERQHELYLMDWDEAIDMDNLVNREREIAKKEAEFAKIEAEKKAKEEADRLEKERAENEAKIKREAEEKAIKDAEAKILAEREAKEKAERDAEEAKLRAEWEAKEALVREENAKLQAEKDAEQAAIKAEEEKRVAIRKATADAEAKAKAEKAAQDKLDAEAKAVADRKAANKKHQASVNNKILDSILNMGIECEIGKKLIIEIAQGRVPFLQINY